MQLVMAYGVDEVLFLGDFNMTPTLDLDRFTSASQWSSGLAQWVSAFHLVDAWRHFYPTLREFSRHSVSYRMFSRIDLIFANRTALNSASEVTILPRGVSDHTPVCIKLWFGVPRKRLWRLSKSLGECAGRCMPVLD